ncbi:MAG: PAS domain S-box protein [Nitrospirae bacterium]|nr:PAS domain S-box protein [Nitrospirota bacterium]
MELRNISGKYRRPRLVLLSVLLFGAAVSVSLLMSARIGVRMVERYVPLQDASMMIKHELAMFHLDLHRAAETGSGEHAAKAYAHLDSAEKNARLMLDGGEGPEGRYQPLDDPELRKDIVNVIGELMEVRGFAGKYLSQGGGTRFTPDEDRRFDATFEHILAEADKVERGLHEKIGKNLLEYEVITAALFFSALVFTVIAGMSLYRYAGRQSGYIDALSEYGRRLEEKERDLARALGKVRESEAKFRVLVEKSLVGVYIIQDKRFRYVNPTMSAIMGYSEDELLAFEDFMELVVPADRGLVADKVADRLSGRVQTVRYVSRWTRKDGETVDIEVMGSLTEYEGRPAIIGTLLDVTERRLAEEELKRKERQQKAILDNIPDMAWLKDADGRFIAANDAFGNACGRKPEEIVGLDDRALWPAELAERYIADDREVMSSGKRKSVEEPLSWKDRGVLWIHTIKTPITNEQGEVIGTTGVARDITDRKKAVEALIDSETKYRIVADNTYDWEFWLAPDGRFLYSSPSCERVTGHGASEFEDDPSLLSRIIHPEDAAAFTSHRHDVGERPGATEFRIVTPDGAERWIEHLCQPVYDEQGQFLGHRGNNRDITERKRLERDRADFYAMVTHDLKSPLAAIMGYAELLQTLRPECIDGEPAEMVGGIARSAGKLLRLVEDFLAVSKMESGRLQVSAFPDDLAEALRDTVAEFTTIAGKKGLTFNAGIPEGIPPVGFDRKLVTRAVANLLQNAVNYTPAGGRVELSAALEDDALTITVCDTGPGIPPEEREKVFEKYYRSAKTSSARGSGLGLTIVKAVAEAHGGRVELSCPETGGSVFRLVIPRI